MVHADLELADSGDLADIALVDPSIWLSDLFTIEILGVIKAIA